MLSVSLVLANSGTAACLDCPNPAGKEGPELQLLTQIKLAFAPAHAETLSPTIGARIPETLGWFLIPLAAIAAIGLWTPLAIGLIPAGVIVAVSLIRMMPLVGVIWLVLNAVVGLFLAWQQLGDILAADDGSNAAEFAQSIVAVTTAVMLRRNQPLAFGIAGPAVFAGLLAIAFIPGTDAAGTSRIQSYYVLKALDAAWLWWVSQHSGMWDPNPTSSQAASPLHPESKPDVNACERRSKPLWAIKFSLR